MQTVTTAQLRKIFLLAKERGLTNELLHVHVFTITSKESLKELSIIEAVKVIDSLAGERQTTGQITKKQLNYINGLAQKLYWTDATNAPDQKILNSFIEKQYGISSIKWLTTKQAAKVIEGMKALLAKDKKSDLNKL